MTNLNQIIRQLKSNQESFFKKLELLEEDNSKASEIILRDLIQDAREIHEGTVILSYLAYQEEEIDEETQSILSFEEASKEEVTASQFSEEEESDSEEELLINALDKAISNTKSDIISEQPNQEILREINSVKEIIDQEDAILEKESASQEEINIAMESIVSSTISNHTSEKTIGDNLNKEDNSLAAKLAKKKIENLVSAIGINEKFLFTNELFKGNTEQFLQEINTLNQKENWILAKSHLENLAEKNNWNKEDGPYLKLTLLVERKFS